MDLTRQALQINAKFFFYFVTFFRISYIFFFNNRGIGFVHARWGGGSFGYYLDKCPLKKFFFCFSMSFGV